MLGSAGLLDSKVIIIAGGTKGVGRDLAIACAHESANVVICGRDVSAAEVIVAEAEREPGQVSYLPLDMRDVESCKSIFDTAHSKFGRIDGYVNYAGVTDVASLLDADQDVFDKVIETNLRGAFFCVQNAVKYMIQSGGGSVVLIGTPHSERGEADRAVYACSKGALKTLQEHLAFHYSKYGVRCNTLIMGWSATEGELALRRDLGIGIEELRCMAEEAIPMGRMQDSEDYIPGIIYLLSEQSSMVTGSYIRVSGGSYI